MNFLALKSYEHSYEHRVMNTVICDSSEENIKNIFE